MNTTQITESEIFQNRLAWAASLKGRPKTFGKLTTKTATGEADCCLGVACKTLSIPRCWDQLNAGFAYDGIVRWQPNHGQKLLGIEEEGALTPAGNNRAYKLTGQTRASLAAYNDYTYAADATLDNMKQLIDWLLVLEYLFDVQCFERP